MEVYEFTQQKYLTIIFPLHKSNFWHTWCQREIFFQIDHWQPLVTKEIQLNLFSCALSAIILKILIKKTSNVDPRNQFFPRLFGPCKISDKTSGAFHLFVASSENEVKNRTGNCEKMLLKERRYLTYFYFIQGYFLPSINT